MYCYEIKNLVNGKRYFGITNNPKQRWDEHRRTKSSILCHAFKKYDIKNFRFTIICAGSLEYIKDLEIRAIAYFNTQVPSGYNITSGGDGVWDYRHSKETRKKISQANRGRKCPMTGKHHTVEAIEKIRAAALTSNGMLGERHSKETKEKLRQKALGRKIVAISGGNNINAKRVLVEGKEYACLKDAADFLGLKADTFRARFRYWKKTNTFPEGYAYIE